jgi:Pectate lyase superfamily protein
VAIVQISQITNRKGLAADLPQLAGAELGWSTDTRQLWIGNGTLADGAPVIGNTEILTEFSDIVNIAATYTYKGQAAGYTVQTGPTSGTPVVQSLQSWLDQFATVKDFGAVGDGITDDTAAINRALYQLFCRETNPQIRRSLFFPAGVYLVSGTINIPPYATLYGEGADNSVITLIDGAGVVPYVAQTADSLQQTGVNIGSNGAEPPQYVTVSNLGFKSLDPLSSIFYLNDATNCRFQNTGFYGPLTKANLTTEANGTVGVEFGSTASLITSQIVFDGCVFSGTVWGVNTDQQIQGITFANSEFNTLYYGILLGTGTPVLGGPTGVRIVSNLFNNIYAEGIIFGDVSLNASGHNIFYDVGNHFTGSTGTPSTAVISIQSANNLSISDLFQRSDSFATTFPRVDLNDTASIATTNGSELAMGTYVRQTGTTHQLINDTTANIFTINANAIRAFKIDYTIVRSSDYRTGTITIATDTPLNYSDDYTENNDTGVTIAVSQIGSTVTVSYTTTDTGVPGTIHYSITHLA